MVEVYDDRVEIVNPGIFPGAKKSDFSKISVRRNERIADMFFRMDKVERAGTGIRRMKEAMTLAGLIAPGIRQTGFYTIIFKRPVSEKLGDRLGGKLGEGAVERPMKKGVEKGVEKISANEKIIYDLVNKDPHISKNEIMVQGKLTKKTVEYNIEKLKKKGFLKRIGPDKGGHWEIQD